MAMGDNLETTILANQIWKSDVLPRIQTFSQMCLHNNIGFRKCFGTRGVLEDINCLLCNRETKSILHALHDCEKIKPVQIQLGIEWTNPYFWIEISKIGQNLMGKQLNVSSLEILLQNLSSFLLFGLYGKTGTIWSLKGKAKTQAWQQKLRTKMWSIIFVHPRLEVQTDQS